jgi:hypothetical protein
MHGELARRLRHVSIARFVDALDMLPTHPIGRHRSLASRRTVKTPRHQRRDDIVGVRGFGEVIERPSLTAITAVAIAP